MLESLLRRRLHITDLIMGVVGLTVILLITYGSIHSLASGKYSLEQWLSFVIDGLVQGSVYALIALGYTLVYGILRMINFAHGEIFMSGAFTTYFLAVWMDGHGWLDAHPILTLLAMMLFSALISMTIAVLLERLAYRSLRGAPRLIPLITAIGASFFLQYTFRGLYGSGVERYPQAEGLKGSVTWLGLQIPRVDIVVIASAVVLMLALYFFVQRTKAGMAMRAVSEDQRVAALMGIDVDRVIVMTFAIGGALAGAAGVLYALIFGQVQFFMGFIPGLKAFTAAVLGGIGNVPGAMLGGLFLGIVESVGPFLFLEGLGVPSPNQLKDAIAFTMLVLVLIFRPTGILGERISKRA
jgi:branched-chain amino acid transport system permease protein